MQKMMNELDKGDLVKINAPSKILGAQIIG